MEISVNQIRVRMKEHAQTSLVNTSARAYLLTVETIATSVSILCWKQ